ncbi:hypothetical protein D0T53_11660 [Dysgonomonas sp. 216]|uniref:hypothetical protein n=1 Tax=Dysgonomonas sp. 216 TaxID=2302934 RepID=UPI0013D2E84D|nr:hypothetical protein [Dysgonomonas sp. 216]NDW19562.1 hypothetical protein [Dysgonomonas sp. 216]
MRYIPILLIFVILFSSCGTTYYYGMFDSNDPYIEKDAKENFVVNGDDVKLTFSFSGEDAQSDITVENKTNRKLYVNWENSWLYIGDGDNNKIKLSSYMNSKERQMVLDSGAIKKQHILEFSNLGLELIDYNNADSLMLKKNKVAATQSTLFTEDDTPLYIRYVIEMSFDKKGEEPYIFEEDFYISKVTKAPGIKPKKIASLNPKEGNTFYVKKDNNPKIKQTAYIASVLGATVGLVTFQIISIQSGNSWW